jgi:hypothetical protein
MRWPLQEMRWRAEELRGQVNVMLGRTLTGAGVIARLGTALGWKHYTAGWHATCTAGAPAAAITAAVARGLGPEQIEVAIALAINGLGWATPMAVAWGAKGDGLPAARPPVLVVVEPASGLAA